jgi:hypothetical protein
MKSENEPDPERRMEEGATGGASRGGGADGAEVENFFRLTRCRERPGPNGGRLRSSRFGRRRR